MNIAYSFTSHVMESSECWRVLGARKTEVPLSNEVVGVSSRSKQLGERGQIKGHASYIFFHKNVVKTGVDLIVKWKRS